MLTLLGLLWLLCPFLASASAEPINALPPWQMLEFEQKVYWATARSHIEVQPDPAAPQQLLLKSTSSVASALVSNIERMQLTLGSDGSLRQRSRVSSGKNTRLKSYNYLADHIERERRDPGTDDSQLPHQWPVSSNMNIDYPELAKGKVITDAYALLLLASRFQTDAAKSVEFVVQTDFNFYRVQMTHSADRSVWVKYQVRDGEKVTGSRQARSVTFAIEPLGELADKPDFSFLGLHGHIIILFDKETGLPVHISGSAPRIGETTIELKKVTMRDAQA